MTAPRRIRLSRARGWRLPDNAVVVSRPSRLGNPFIVGRHGTRLQCAAKFALLAGGFIAFEQGVETDHQLALWRRIHRALHTLAGRDLACWCALDGGACHGDVLLYLANEGAPPPAWMRQPIDMPGVRLGIAARDLEKFRRKGSKEVAG